VERNIIKGSNWAPQLITGRIEPTPFIGSPRPPTPRLLQYELQGSMPPLLHDPFTDVDTFQNTPIGGYMNM
jgi:hypothetical protein